MRIKPSIILLVIFVAATAGCGLYNGPPGSAERRLVHAGDRTIVLMRLSVDVDGSHKSYGDVGMSLAINPNVKQFDEHVTYFRMSPSSDARAGGWYYCLLEPGVYYTELDHAVGTIWDPYKPVFEMAVPRGARLVYAGTIRVGISTESATADRPDGSFSPDSAAVLDQTDAAALVVDRDLPAYRPVTTRLMTLHTETTRIIRGEPQRQSR